MRTKQKGRDVPGPGDAWNEILPHLWMGGHYYNDGSEMQAAEIEDEFDLVVSLYVVPTLLPPPHVEHRILEIPDRPLNAPQIAQVRELAVFTANAVRAERTTLVRCHAGYNRSGLVVVQAMVEMGHDVDAAIALIRQRRSPWALHNATFEEYLRTGLEVAELLSGLTEPA